jgi:midasin
VKANNNIFFGRDVSVRDLIKVVSRISHSVHFDENSTYITESQRTLCFAECYDIFMAACPDVTVRRQFIQDIASPVWGISVQLAIRYIETRSAPITNTNSLYIGVGRAKIAVSNIDSGDVAVVKMSNTFAQTNYALRLMEAIGVCVRENEPVLLVGETGTGKTTILQELAKLVGRDMIAQNLSLQTDSADLLGGYRPLKLAKLARNIYEQFIHLFTGTFSQKQNINFLEFAALALQKEQWKKLSQCFIRASQFGLDKVKQQNITKMQQHQNEKTNENQWIEFRSISQRFEQQRLAATSGPAFAFVEGVLVDAIRTGKWILLDEINLASTETLQRICGLLDDASSSITLTERGDSIPIERHPSFRLFAAMNPATDVGKKDLSVSVRSRFTEIFVDDLRDPLELRLVAANYISRVLPASDRRPECTDTVINVVDLYCHLRDLAETSLVDSSGLKPRYTLRTLSRALAAAKSLVLSQKLPLIRSLYEGFELAFQGSLDDASLQASNKVIQKAFGARLSRVDMNHPGKRPRNPDKNYVLIKPFWIETGMLECVDWADQLNKHGCTSFILTEMTCFNLRRLARGIASGSWPILLEGPTSAGMTYIAFSFHR